MSESHGKIWWNELTVRDTKAAREFYANLCGWTYDTMPMEDGSGDYHIAMIDGMPVAGIFDMTKVPELENVPPHWFTYIAVDDVRAAVEEHKSQGGIIRRECFDVAEVGTIAIIVDSAGAVIGLMTPTASS